MKLLPKGWPNTKEARSLGFLAQTSIELVHEKSWESYKLPSLSTMFRLLEARRVSHSVMKGVLPSKALDPIIEEASSSFSKDHAIQAILRKRELEPSDIAITLEDKPHDVFAQCGFLIDLCKDDYRSENENLLISECFGEGRRSVIYDLLKCYLSDLCLNGQSRKSVEMSVRDAFFHEIPKISRGTLQAFFRNFPRDDKKFDVYGTASGDFLSAIGKIVPVEVIRGSKVPNKIRSLPEIFKGTSTFWVEAEAKDEYSAALRVGKILGIGEAILSFFPGEALGVIPSTLAVTARRKSNYIEAPSTFHFSKRVLSHSLLSAERHMERLKVLLLKPRGSDNVVGADLLRGVMTAALAEKSTAAEVKLLTLWAAFEALLPIVPDGAGNRISHFLKYIVPAVTMSYPRDCFLEFSRDADRLHSAAYRKFLNGIPAKGVLADKLAQVVVSGSEAQKGSLCAIFSNNPLALHRLKSLEDRFGNPDSFQATVEAHSSRVSWQIQRIYRERNTVMHNGESSPFIDHLLSNTYYYFGLVLSNIETVSKSYGGLPTSHALSAIVKLRQADDARVLRAKKCKKENPIKSQALLLQLISGHFQPE